MNRPESKSLPGTLATIGGWGKGLQVSCHALSFVELGDKGSWRGQVGPLTTQKQLVVRSTNGGQTAKRRLSWDIAQTRQRRTRRASEFEMGVLAANRFDRKRVRVRVLLLHWVRIEVVRNCSGLVSRSQSRDYHTRHRVTDLKYHVQLQQTPGYTLANHLNSLR